MKVYLAAPYAARDALGVAVTALQQLGHTVTSSWIHQTHDIHPGTVDAALDHSDKYLADRVLRDMADIDSSDAVILFTAGWAMRNMDLHRHQTISGGRHVEVGYALAKGKFVIILGDPENIFHRGACVLAEDWDEVMGLLYNDNGVGGPR